MKIIISIQLSKKNLKKEDKITEEEEAKVTEEDQELIIQVEINQHLTKENIKKGSLIINQKQNIVIKILSQKRVKNLNHLRKNLIHEEEEVEDKIINVIHQKEEDLKKNQKLLNILIVKNQKNLVQ